MSRNRIAKGIVLVPSLLLGSAFLAVAAWGGGPGGTNQALALTLGLTLIGVGLASQVLPDWGQDDAPEPMGMDLERSDRTTKGP